MDSQRGSIDATAGLLGLSRVVIHVAFGLVSVILTDPTYVIIVSFGANEFAVPCKYGQNTDDRTQFYPVR